jgi:hypothetical protein
MNVTRLHEDAAAVARAGKVVFFLVVLLFRFMFLDLLNCFFLTYLFIIYYNLFIIYSFKFCLHLHLLIYLFMYFIHLFIYLYWYVCLDWIRFFG